MKNYQSSTIVVDSLLEDDHIKVAGVLYRVTQIERIGNAYIIHFHNVRRPMIEGMLTLESNTLMKIWNQK